MKLARRRFLRFAASAATVPALSGAVSASDYPNRPVRLVVGFPAGGAPDILARIVAQPLSERLGQQVAIDNRPGAASNIATELVAKALPDGYTLLAVVSSNAVNAALYPNLNFNFIRDIVAVAFIGANPFVMAVTPSLPAKTFPEFIAYAKANPGKINMGSQGVGTTPHVCGEMLRMMTGIEFTHVPYRGQLMPDLLAGHVHFYFSPMPQPIEYIKDGRLRALGVTTATRSAALPDIPAIAEFVSGYNASGWIGIGAPLGTPSDVIDKLNREINAVVADPQMLAQLAGLGVTARPMTASEFASFITGETEKWGKVVKFASIKPE